MSQSPPGGKGVPRKKQPNRKGCAGKRLAHNTISEDQVETFLQSLIDYPHVGNALNKSGMSRCVAYKMRDEDSEFRRRWEEAVDRGYDAVEDEALRRAQEGVDEPVYQGGQKVGEIRRYSDHLMTLLLRGRRSDRYRDRVQQDVNTKGTVNVTISQDDSKL